MPTYEFECKKCEKKFSQLESIASHDKHKEKCPHCGSHDIHNLISAPTVKTTRKS